MPVVVIIALLLTVIGALAAFAVVFFLKRGGSGKQRARTAPKKDRTQALKDANRALAANPRDPRALQVIADLYYDEKAWDKAMKTYAILVDLAASHSEIVEWEVTARYGLCALQLKSWDDAYRSLMIARTLKDDSFEINYNLGHLEFRRGNIEKAIALLSSAIEQQSTHVASRRYLGRAFHKAQRYREAVRELRWVVDNDPEDKESLFYLAQSYFELGQGEQALMIFTHLRPDPALGPHSALYAGTIHLQKREWEKAALDFELGLRHTEIRPEVMIELRYRLADSYMKQQEIGKALQQLAAIQQVNPSYKDVSAQLSRTKELHGNRNLQTYLISPTSEYVTLCRRMVMTFFRNAKIKILDVSVQKNEFADILTEVETSRWEDIILFRFIRGTGLVGELVVRDLNSRLKETRAGRGYCVTAGTFSETASGFVEARLIDLLDKDELLKIFAKLD